MEHGFIRDMLDVKVLILFVMARVEYPVTAQQIYELCYQDDCLSYFDVQQAIPQMVESGHLRKTVTGAYEITPKGREDGAVTEDAVVYSLAQRVLAAIEQFNREQRRSRYVKTDVIEEGSSFFVHMRLDDEISKLMDLTLMAPSQKQARKLSAVFQKNAEAFYQTIMEILLEDAEELE